MYKVEATGEIKTSYFEAIRAAENLGCNVVMADTGAVRWRPAPTVSAKKMRIYKERLAAYQAQQLQGGK
jgi:hypothetical protein